MEYIIIGVIMFIMGACAIAPIFKSENDKINKGGQD